MVALIGGGSTWKVDGLVTPQKSTSRLQRRRWRWGMGREYRSPPQRTRGLLGELMTGCGVRVRASVCVWPWPGVPRVSPWHPSSRRCVEPVQSQWVPSDGACRWTWSAGLRRRSLSVRPRSDTACPSPICSGSKTLPTDRESSIYTSQLQAHYHHHHNRLLEVVTRMLSGIRRRRRRIYFPQTTSDKQYMK